MRSLHFEIFRPVCPTCRVHRGVEHPLRLHHVAEERAGHVIQGILLCSSASCMREFPIIDGIPIILDNLRAFLSHNALAILGRSDLAPPLSTLLGDSLGPGSSYDVLRQHVSHYASDHWGEFAEEEAGRPSAALELLEAGLELTGFEGGATALDLGCATGRCTFAAAAKTTGPVLGVDLHFGMLRVAAGVLRTGRARYSRRREGLVYDACDIEITSASAPAHAERVDFWLADATALPLQTACADLVVSLNVLDCVQDPRGHLAQIARSLRPGGQAVLTSPYDWSASATSVEAWIGGHSQRSPARGASATNVRALLDGEGPGCVEGLEIVTEREQVPWRVRLHDRCTIEYATHMLALTKTV